MAGKNGRKQRFDSNAQTSSFSERPQLSRIFFAEYHCFTRREIAVPPLGQAQKKSRKLFVSIIGTFEPIFSLF
jgi:hypothetical protein